MNDDEDPDDLRYLKRTRDKESKKTKKEDKMNADKYEKRNEDGKKEDGKNENGKNEPKEEDKNMDTGGISDEANGRMMIVMRQRSLNMQGIMINAILQESSLLEKVLYLQLSLGGERLSSIQTRELTVARNGTLENRNIRRFYSPFLITSSPWSRTCQDLFSSIFRSPVNRESILTVENVVLRGYTVSLFKIIILNYTNAQMCFSALQEEFTAGIASMSLMQAAGDDSYGLFRGSFGNSGSLLIITDATKGRRLLLATTPLSYLNDSRILLFVWQEAFTAEGVNLQLVQAAEDNSSRAIIVRTQFRALVPVEVLRFRCEPYSGPHNSDGRQSQGALRPLRSRERPPDLGDLNQEGLVSVVASMVSEQANMPASRTRAKEWSCAIAGRCDSACESAPSPRCKMKAKGPSPESSSSKRNTIRSTNVGFERNKDPVNMNAALKPPRHLIHRNTFPASKGDDEMFFSGTMAAHSKRRSSNTLLNYPTQCTDTGGHAVACDSNFRYESACKAESEDVCTQGTSCKRPAMETGWQLNNACEDERDKIIVDGTNTSGNNGGARRKTTGINGETETQLRTPVQCEEDLCSVHHNNAPGHMTRGNGDPDFGNQGGVRRRPVLRMRGTVLYAQCDEDLLFE